MGKVGAEEEEELNQELELLMTTMAGPAKLSTPGTVPATGGVSSSLPDVPTQPILPVVPTTPVEVSSEAATSTQETRQPAAVLS